MKIEREGIRRGSIEEFAEEYELTMFVSERGKHSPDAIRYYAHFKGASMKEANGLLGMFGNGRTEEKAVEVLST